MNEIEKAIEALKMENDLMQFNPITGEDYPIELQNQDNQDLYKANLIAMAALEKQKNNGWISVSERMPDGFKKVLTCDEYGNIHVFYYDKFQKHPFGIGPNDITFYMPVAWQPLPEPFKGGENENRDTKINER